MNSKTDRILAALLLVSLISVGTAGASETQLSVQHLDASNRRVAENSIAPSMRHPIELTARLELAALENDPPKSRVVATGAPDSSTNVAPETAPRDADDWKNWHPAPAPWHPDWHPELKRQEPGGAGWIVGGILVAIPLGVGGGVLLANAAPNNDGGRTAGLAIAGGVVAGVGGYFLGTLARNGSWGAKGSVTFLAVIEVAAVVVLGVAATAFVASGGLH